MCFVQKRLCFSSLRSKFKPLNRLGMPFDENIKKTQVLSYTFSVCYTVYSSLNFSKILFLQGKCGNSLGSALHAGAILQQAFKSSASLRSKRFRARSSRKLERDHLFVFCSRFNLRAITRWETLATQAIVKCKKIRTVKQSARSERPSCFSMQLFMALL